MTKTHNYYVGEIINMSVPEVRILIPRGYLDNEASKIILGVRQAEEPLPPERRRNLVKIDLNGLPPIAVE